MRYLIVSWVNCKKNLPKIEFRSSVYSVSVVIRVGSLAEVSQIAR